MGEVTHILTLDEIVAADDYRTRVVPVPEWGGSVRVQTFTKDKEMSIRAASRDGTGQIDSERFEFLMLVHGILEPELTEGAITMLRTKNAAAVDRILQAINDLNRMNPEGVAEAAGMFPEGTGDAVPVPAGAGPEDDGQAA